MPEIHLKQSGFIYSACEPFTKNKERIQNIKEIGDLQYTYQKEQIKLVLIMTWLMDILKI